MTSDNSVQRTAFLDAALVSTTVLGAFVYWFVVADRSVVFLYGQSPGRGVRFEPFDPWTAARYPMTGLIACGVIGLVRTAAYLVAGRLARRPLPVPPWWLVWLLAAVPLTIGIPLVTMVAGDPALPALRALECLLAALAGLAAALWPAEWAARCPRQLAWLVVDAVGLMPAYVSIRFLDLPGLGWLTPAQARRDAAYGVAVSVIYLLALTALRRWRAVPVPPATSLLVVAGVIPCLGFPVLHYLLAEPDTHYVTDWGNVSGSTGVAVVTVTVAVTVAFAVTALRRWLDGGVPAGPAARTAPEPTAS